MAEILDEINHINDKISKLYGIKKFIQDEISENSLDKISKLSVIKKFIQDEISENSLDKIPLIQRLYDEMIEPAAKETGYSVSVDVSNFIIGSGKIPFDGKESSFMEKYAKTYVEDHANKILRFVLENRDYTKVMFVELQPDRLGISLEDGMVTHYASSKESMVKTIKDYQTIQK